MRKFLSIFSLVPLLLSGCFDLFEPECHECQDAINHMNEKIIQQNCNPLTMENAWNSIKEHCGNLADIYVGVLAETCSKGNVYVPQCHYDEISLNLGKHNIKLHFFTSTGVPDTLGIIVLFKNTSFDFGFKGNDSVSKLFDLVVYEDEEVEIVVQNALSNVEFARGTRQLTFNRQGYWSSDRGIDIKYNNSNGSYSLQFFSW